MPRLDAAELSELDPESREMMLAVEKMMGFIPNDGMIMARNPALMHSFSNLVMTIYAPSQIEPTLKRMIGLITSTAAGCSYCRAHTAHAAHNLGVDDQKIEDAWSYETSDLFTDAERAALRVAQGAGLSPNTVTDEQIEDLKKYYNDEQVIEIVSVISLFGFMNRWNSTFMTELETSPLSYAQNHLKDPTHDG